MAQNRISFCDLRRLRRDVLPDGIATREQAETLLALDLIVERADKGWSGYMVSGVRDLVLSAAPPGCIDADTTQWLMSALNGSSPKTGRAIAREILREGPEASRELRALVTEARRERSAEVIP
jgi:hypothetical protein